MEDDNRRATKSAGRTSDLLAVAQDLCAALCEAALFAISVNRAPYFWTHLCSAFLLSFDLALPWCLSPLYLPWCKKGSKCPGCHLQLELHLLLSMMPANGISTVANGAMECSHSLQIQYSSWGTGEFQDSLSKCLQVQEVQIITVSLCLLSDVFSSSIWQPRNALLVAHSFRQDRNSLLNTVALILQCLHGNCCWTTPLWNWVISWDKTHFQVSVFLSNNCYSLTLFLQVGRY